MWATWSVPCETCTAFRRMPSLTNSTVMMPFVGDNSPRHPISFIDVRGHLAQQDGRTNLTRQSPVLAVLGRRQQYQVDELSPAIPSPETSTLPGPEGTDAALECCQHHSRAMTPASGRLSACHSCQKEPRLSFCEEVLCWFGASHCSFPSERPLYTVYGVRFQK